MSELKGKGKFKLNSKGVKELLQSQQCQAVCKSEAAKMGDLTEEYVGTQRAWAIGVKKE